MTVARVISRQGRDLAPLINEEAGRLWLPTRALTALLLAESHDLDEHAERYGVWPDVSFGLGQQTVAYAPVGDHSNTRKNIEYVRNYYFDPRNAIREAARQLAAHWDKLPPLMDQRTRFLEADSRYNGGSNMSWANNPNKDNIARAWDAAASYEIERSVGMADFVEGFLDLAESLGRDVVGEPLSDEYQSGPTTRQPTTRGEMIWTPGGQPLFLPAVQP